MKSGIGHFCGTSKRESGFSCINKESAMKSLDSFVKSNMGTSSSFSARIEGTSFKTFQMDPRPRCRRNNCFSSISLIFFIIFCFLFGLGFSSPIRQPSICGPSVCKAELDVIEDTEIKFHYKGGSIYSYQYVVNGTSSVLGGPPTQSGLHLSAKVTIRFLTACDAILFIKDVDVLQSYVNNEDGNEDFNPVFKQPTNRLTFIKSLEQFPLRFSYGDGLIEEICPHSEESSWALNIKRGFLSAYQNTMRRLDLEHKGEEDDVHGHCKVEYRIGTATSSALTIEKVKDLSSCGDKFGILSSVHGTPYSFGTLHQSMPAVVSTSECEHIVDRNLLSGVRCLESHRLRSLARGVSGAYMNIQQNLELVSVYVPPLVVGRNDSGAIGELGSFDEDIFDDDEEEEGDETKNKHKAGQVEDEQTGNSPWIITRNPDVYISTLINKTPESISRRESLLFRHDYNLGQTTNDYNTAKNGLANFCSSVKTEIGRRSGELFEALVYVLRGLSSDEMMSISKDAMHICKGDREPFDDALEAVGTGASLGVIRDRILKSDSSPKRINSWINSLSFIPKPDLALLTAAVPILRARDNYPNILLTFSNLAHSYCKDMGQRACSKQQPIAILTKLYEKYFAATGCATKRRKDTEQVLMYLKGIGNFGMYSNGIGNALGNCIKKNDKTEIRVAAIDAFRRMPCQLDGGFPILRKLFENQLEDTEVRISAFIGIMRCPNYPTIRWIKEALDNEQVNQVGSFVWTYLTNLQETALPSKAELQALLADENLTSKFSTDLRKFSRNFEISTFYKDANFGVGLDGNLIFSQTSYLPRSASVNLTVDLFGESINVVEGTMRVESFEHYVESIFGPSGKLSSLSKSNLGSSPGKRREKRGTPSKRKMRTLALEYDAMKRYYSDPIASLSLKTFGNEIFFKRAVGIQEQTEALSGFNPFKLFESMGNQEDTNWQKSRLLLDSSYIIPTGVGFPLNLSAQASSIIRLESESVIDSSSSTGFKIKGKLIPSAMLTVVGSMTLSASDIHTGLKVRAHLRSSTAVEGTFHIQGATLLDVEFGLPKSQLELLEYTSDLMFMEGDEFRAVGELESGQNPICTGGLFYRYLGLKLCSSSYFSLKPAQGLSIVTKQEENDEESHPDYLLAPYFPLNGPSYFILTLDKANPSLLKTRFHYVWNNNQTNTQLTLQGTTYTGESRESATAQRMGFNFELDKENQNFDMELKSPSNSLKASGQLEKDWSSGDLDIQMKHESSSIFSTSGTYKVTTQSNGKSVMKPILTIQRGNKNVLVAQGEIEITKSAEKVFNGKGKIEYGEETIDLRLEGGYNESSVTLNWEGDYRNGKTIKCTSRLTTLGKHYSKESTKEGIDSELTFEFSEFPQYNLAVSWKYQANEEGFDHEGEFSQGVRYERKKNDRSNLWARVGGLSQRGHEGSRHKWLLLISQPSQGIDCGFEVGLTTHGKSLDSTINLRYAPEKNLETSLSLKRAPGVLTFMEIGWNITLPNQHPVQLSFHLEEKAHRVYQAHFITDWYRDKLMLEVEYSDRSKKSRLDKSISLGVTTKAIDNFKLGFHVFSEDKETKIQLSSDYKGQMNTFELGHSQVGRVGRKHKLFASLTSGDKVYLVMSEIDLEHGFQCIVKTDLGSNFADIYARVKATNQNGMQIFGMEYSWDASRDRSKQFLMECFLDLSQQHLKRTEALLTFPGYNYFLNLEFSFLEEERSGSVAGKMSWKKDEDGGHLHLNGRLGPRRGESSVDSTSDDDEAYDASLQVATPFSSLKNVSFNLGLDFFEERSVCQIKFDGIWGDDQKLTGSLESKFESLSPEEEEREGEGDNDEEEDFSPDDEHENEIRIKSNPQNQFKFTFEGNITSKIKNFEVVNIKLNHLFYSYFNLKTDVDIQLPNEKEISVSNHWVLPKRLSDLLSTRAELHIKTPFVGFQNVDLQAILGRKEDRDVLALIGIYIENFQYAVSITGTPRFEEDGALGFDVTTSNPKYDKIFGSFSYVIGDNTRLACQVGWPQVVIGMEAGWEWVGWEDFQVYYTFTSPWMPMKNINALVKVDGAQLAEFKLEANEDSINAKCEWVIVTWTNFDIRLDGSTPFEETRKFGSVLKNAWEDEVSYQSQAVAWINDQQVGYKLEGGQSELEEAEVVAIVMNSQLEIDTIVYPTIRGLFSLAQREARFNLAMSLTLREGPINIEGQLDLLDVFRFNENITITTPYPGLFELEINLSPALAIQDGLFNIGLQSKWRSYSQWHEGGLVIRLGPQGILSDMLTQEAQDAMDLNPPGEEYDDGAESPSNINEDGEIQVKRVRVPMSQLFHFYSPLGWAKVIKLEYEPLSTSSASDIDKESQLEEEEDSGDEQDSQNRFPIRNFVIVYNGDMADFSTELHNGQLKKTLTGSIDLRMIEEQRLSFKFDNTLDLSEPEKKFNLLAASYHPSVREYSLGTTWTKELPQYLQGKVEIKTPLENWEEQSGSVMYAHNDDDATYSVDVELFSLAYEKLATNVAVGPRHFSMTLNTPFQGLEELELRGDTSPKEEDSSDTLNTLITVKSAEKELEIDVDSLMSQQGWPKEIKGTISTTFGLDGYRQGGLKANVEKTENGVNANGEIEWKNNQRLGATLFLSLPGSRFQELNLTVDTPFSQAEHWEMWLHHHQPTDDQIDIKIQAKTPFHPFSSLNAQGLLEFGSSLLEMKKISLKAESPNSSVGLNSTWHLESWNRFGVYFESKYIFNLDPKTKSQYKLLSHLPNENGLKLKLRHSHPDLQTFTNMDSKFSLENMKPPYRLGAGVTTEFIEGESFTMKLTSKYGKNALLTDLQSKFNENFEEGEAKLVLNATGGFSKSYRSTVQWKQRDENSLDGEAEIEWGTDGHLVSSSVQSTFNCSWPQDNDVQLHLRVGYPSVDTNTTNTADSPLISIDGSFNRISSRHSARLQVGQEGLDENPITLKVDLMLKSLQDFASSMNITSNFEDVSQAGVHISNQIDGSVFDGLVGGHWEDDKLNLKYYFDYQNTDDIFKVNVSLDAEIPVSTESVPKPQTGSIMTMYKVEEVSEITDWEFRGIYNGVQLVNANYNFNSESSAGLKKEKRHVEFENHFWPFGLNTLYQYEYSGGYQGLNLPTKTVRSLEVYDLGQPDLHKLEGELQIKTNFTGREITLTGRHPKRETQLITDYEFLDHRFKQRSRLTWGPQSWLGYELDIMNKTNTEKTEHEVGFRLTYPIRVITLNSGYKYQDSSLKWTTDMNFNASKSDRRLVGIVTWDTEQPSVTSTIRKVGVTIKHPTLTQDLRAEGQLQTDGWDLIEGKLWMDYTGDLNKGLTLLVKTQPEFSKGFFYYFPYWNVSTDIRLQHSATNLDLKTLHLTQHSAHELSIITLIDFKNSKKSLPEESKIAFELFKQLGKAHIMIHDPEEYCQLEGQLSGQYPHYTLEGETNVSRLLHQPKARMSLDLKRPYFKMYAVHGKDLTDGLYSEGGVIDSRNVKFDIWESYDNFRFSDVSFFLRLNHSKLITSKLKWRPELFAELKELAENVLQNVSRIVTSKTDRLLDVWSEDASDVANALWDDARGRVGPFLEELSEECDFRNDSAALQFFFEEMHSQNDFYVQDILGFTQLFFEEISMRISETLEKLKTYREDLANESLQVLDKAVLWFADKVKEVYEQLVSAWENYKSSSWSPSISFADIKQHISLILYYSVGFVVKLSAEIYGSLSSLASSMAIQLNNIVERYQPGILAHIHQIESIVYNFIVKVSDYVYETKEGVMKSPYYQKIAQLAEDLDALYRDISQNDAATNIKKYYNMLKTFLARKLSEIDDLVSPLGHIGTRIMEIWEKVKGLEWVDSLKESLSECWEKMKWLMEYTNLDETIQEFLLLLYSRGDDLFSQTVLQAGAQYQTAKTKFIFDADKGIISLEQKLPMPWAAFNETPDFQQLPEYQHIVRVQDLFQSSEGSFWDVYYKVKPDSNLLNWLPPFDGHAMLVGSEYFFTFDGLAYNFTSSCVYLLAADLVDGNFSISLQFNKESATEKTSYNIMIAAGHNTLVIDMEQNGLRDPKRGGQQILNLPVQMQNLQGYKDGDRLVVESPKGISVSCNTVYRICQFWVSGWYSRKTAGLLGTMDEEPITDLALSNGKTGTRIEDMVNSWDLSDDSPSESCPTENNKRVIQVDSSEEQKQRSESTSNSSKIAYTCQKLFQSKMSSLQPCFASVKSNPYYNLCLMAAASGTTSSTPFKNESSTTICTSVVAYVSACKTSGVSLKIPSMCIKCDMNGEEMIDGDMRVISSPPAGSPTFRSTDVVFIVEAKDCNRALRARRKIDILVKSLEEELKKNNFKQNRYAAVLFGGDGVYDKPHTVIHNNEAFTTASGIGKYLASLPTGNGSQDIFNGIWYTLQQLNFRPGVSKTLILFPCSSCQPQHMKMDFSDIHYAMLEQGATLHVMMDENFDVDKNLGKKFFGMDNDLAFTKSDGVKDKLKGDPNVRRQVKVQRSILGYCTPLALQTNGTVFSGKKLQNKRENIVQLFSTAFSRRVVQTAIPADCQTCYCTANSEDGVGKIQCFVCGYPRYKSMPEDDEDFEDGASENKPNLTPNEPEPDIEIDGYEDANISEEDED